MKILIRNVYVFESVKIKYLADKRERCNACMVNANRSHYFKDVKKDICDLCTSINERRISRNVITFKQIDKKKIKNFDQIKPEKKIRKINMKLIDFKDKSLKEKQELIGMTVLRKRENSFNKNKKLLKIIKVTKTKIVVEGEEEFNYCGSPKAKKSKWDIHSISIDLLTDAEVERYREYFRAVNRCKELYETAVSKIEQLERTEENVEDLNILLQGIISKIEEFEVKYAK